MACFSRESGSWGDSCVALLGAACLLVAILASAFTVAQWQRNREDYRWTHCTVSHVTDDVWLECPLNKSSLAAGAADVTAGVAAGRGPAPGGPRSNSTAAFPCVRVMVTYVDDHGQNRMGILHSGISDVPAGSDAPRCSVTSCAGTTAQNEALVRRFSERWRQRYELGAFSCYYNTTHLGEVFPTRPHTSWVLELVVLFTVVICVVCMLTTAVRCRCVYLNAREARSCVPSMSFYVTSSVRSLQALLWTVAYKLFDWKLQNSMSQTLSGNDTQGLVEQYREEREDADPCLPPGSSMANTAIPRSPSVGYSQPRPSNAQTYTPLACPPSDIRL